MVKHPAGNILLPVVENCEIKRLQNPTVEIYRFLYDKVGSKINWNDRKILSNEDLKKIIEDPNLEIFVAYIENAPAGYIELDFNNPKESKIAYFGVFPEFYGKKIGANLLGWGIKYCWGKNPEKIWLHTCDLDHPNALPLYIKAGFVPYKKEIQFVAKL